jgi:hypothetical protein
MKKVLILLAVGAILLPSLAFSQKPVPSIPHMINYQGMLTDNSGNPLTGNFDITFRIYNASSGGTLRWEETHYSVTVTNGLFNVILGNAGTPINLGFNEEYWLDITVAGEHMPSRMKLTSVGYAYRAQVADTAAYAIGVPEGDLDDRYVNVIGPDSVRYSGSSNGLILTSTGTNGEALYCRTYGTGDADAIKISTRGSTADGIYIDTTGDCGLEIDDTADDGIQMDDIHGDGLQMTDVDGDGISIDDVSVDGVHMTDVDGYGIYMQNMGGHGINITGAVDRAISIDSSGNNWYGIYLGHAGMVGLKIAGADNEGVDAQGHSGNRLRTASSSYYGLYVHSYTSSSTNKGLYVYGTIYSTGKQGTILSGSSGEFPAFSVLSRDVEVITSGSGTLIKGEAQITFEKEFQEVISPDIPIRVVVTAQDAPSALLYVTNKSTQGFQVKPLEVPELGLKTDNVSFDWIAIARQKGYEQRPQVDIPAPNEGSEEPEAAALESSARHQRMVEREAQREAERIKREQEENN